MTLVRESSRSFLGSLIESTRDRLNPEHSFDKVTEAWKAVEAICTDQRFAVFDGVCEGADWISDKQPDRSFQTTVAVRHIPKQLKEVMMLSTGKDIIKIAIGFEWRKPSAFYPATRLSEPIAPPIRYFPGDAQLFIAAEGAEPLILGGYVPSGVQMYREWRYGSGDNVVVRVNSENGSKKDSSMILTLPQFNTFFAESVQFAATCAVLELQDRMEKASSS